MNSSKINEMIRGGIIFEKTANLDGLYATQFDFRVQLHINHRVENILKSWQEGVPFPYLMGFQTIGGGPFDALTVTITTFTNRRLYEEI